MPHLEVFEESATKAAHTSLVFPGPDARMEPHLVHPVLGSPEVSARTAP